MDTLRDRARLLGGIAAILMAAIYACIGIGIFQVGGSTSGEATDLTVFGFAAATAFLVTAGLLLTTDRRWLWVLAAIFQVGVFVTYFAVAGARAPSFEIWGLTLRLIQIPLIGVVLYLAWRSPQRRVGSRLT